MEFKTTSIIEIVNHFVKTDKPIVGIGNQSVAYMADKNVVELYSICPAKHHLFSDNTFLHEITEYNDYLSLPSIFDIELISDIQLSSENYLFEFSLHKYVMPMYKKYNNFGLHIETRKLFDDLSYLLCAHYKMDYKKFDFKTSNYDLVKGVRCFFDALTKKIAESNDCILDSFCIENIALDNRNKLVLIDPVVSNALGRCRGLLND